MAPDELAVAAAEWQLDRLPLADVQSLAMRLLEEGHTSPAVHELASTPGFALGGDLRNLVEKAFADVGHELPTRQEAAMLLSRQAAAAILSDELPPNEGAQRIWTLAYDVDDANSPKLTPFVVFASAIEDHPDLAEHYEPLIKEEAARFLGDQT